MSTPGNTPGTVARITSYNVCYTKLLRDRAENLFLELAEIRLHSEQALQLLLRIYQQEKEWDKAISSARIV